jgi:hypothetical protein
MTRGEYNDYRGWLLPSNESREEEGYLIEYEPRLGEESNVKGHEGYVTWTPKHVFDDAYHDVNSALPFGLALELAKQGCSIARRGWYDKGLKVAIQPMSKDSDITLPYLYMQYPVTPASGTTSDSYTYAKVPWIPLQVDILSSDWFIIKEDKEI